MKWEKSRESDNVVEDDGGDAAFQGGRRYPAGGFKIGIGGIVVIVIASLIFGINPIDVLTPLMSSSPSAFNTQGSRQTSPVTSNDPQVKFVRSILGSTEDVWGSYFQSLRASYEQPRLQLFNGHVNSGCGAASESMGPFYCSSDHRVYLDLDFFQDMESQFHATGDFARAYVIAHEVGHHVQNLIGVTDKVDRAISAGQPMEGADGLSVRLELQADCFAGVWANRSETQLNWLQEGDVEEAMNAAQQIGDDLLQKRSQGFAVPDSFTHGTSAQRARWFRAGLSAGDIKACDTFRGNL